MDNRLDQLIAAVVALPERQRSVLLPLFAWAIIKDAPEGRVVPPHLAAEIERFFTSLGKGSDEDRAVALQARLREAGVTDETYRALALESGLPASTVDLRQLGVENAGRFDNRAEPSAGQVRSGPLARSALQSVAPNSDPRAEGAPADPPVDASKQKKRTKKV